MSDFVVFTTGTGRGRYRRLTHTVHLKACKQKGTGKKFSIPESVWGETGEAGRLWGDQRHLQNPEYNYERFLNYAQPQFCEHCMGPRSVALARTEFWLYAVQSGRVLIAAQKRAALESLIEWANELERIHPYTPLLKSITDAWIDGDTAPNPDPKRSWNRRKVEWRWDYERLFRKTGEYIEFRLSNIHWSDVLRIKVIPEGEGVRVYDINHSTAAIVEPNDARRLARIFDVIENWKKEAAA